MKRKKIKARHSSPPAQSRHFEARGGKGFGSVVPKVYRVLRDYLPNGEYVAKLPREILRDRPLSPAHGHNI